MFRLTLYISLIILLASACTNARWIANDEREIDPNDYQILSTRQFPDPVGIITPEDPTLRLRLLARSSYEYSEKIVIGRYIQDYRINPFFLSLGLLGAGTAFYLANSKAVKGISGRVETVTFNALGGIIALGTFLNLNPSGDPRPTGEERFLRETGTRIVTDTTEVVEAVQDSAFYNIYYGDTPVLEGQGVNIVNGMMEIDLGTPLSQMELQSTDPLAASVTLQYSDTLYTFSYPLESLLRPFARVETRVTELRNSPEDSSTDNVLAELVEGSRLQIVEETEGPWMKVLYGISETYVLRNDVSRVWLRSGFAQNNTVTAVPIVPFGNIDVENNIPILVSSNENAIALLIGNELYSGPYTARKYVERDLQLVETYLSTALGYPQQNIFTLRNLSGTDLIDSAFEEMQEIATDSSDIFVYLSGYGSINGAGEGAVPRLLFSSGGQDAEGIDLSGIFDSIAELPSDSKVIISDIDFSRSVNDNQSIAPELQQHPLSLSARNIASRYDNLAVLFSSEFGQQSHIYLGQGEDKKHHIFPYFIASAIQQRYTSIGQIYDYLQRNVSYTSRRLHDQSQDPILFGSRSLDLAGEE